MTAGVLAGALGLALLVVGAIALRASDGGADTAATTTTAGMMVAADGVLDLASVPESIAREYEYARAHAEQYETFRCWCGCDDAYQHASLAQCFVRRDGQWEAHGAGCGICIAEAMTARARLDHGVPAEAIAAELDAEYGPPTPPATTDSPGEDST